MDSNLKEQRLKMHSEAHTDLVNAANKHLKENGNTALFRSIGRAVGCSHVTVFNYIQGDCGDGFLTKILTKAFKQYKP